MPDQEKLNQIIDAIGDAIRKLSPEEIQFLKESQKQIDEAAASQAQGFDRRMEFCYNIIFNPDKITYKPLIDTVKAYIDLIEKG